MRARLLALARAHSPWKLRNAIRRDSVYRAAGIAQALDVLAAERIEESPLTAVVAARMALALLRRDGPSPLAGSCAHHLGHAAQRLGRHDRALWHLGTAADIYRGLDLLEQAAHVDLRANYSLRTLGLHEQARAVVESVLAWAKAAEHAGLQAQAYFELGGIEFRLDHYRLALQQYRHCTRLESRVPWLVEVAALWSNIANCLVAMNRFSAAFRHFERALQILRATPQDRLALGLSESNRAYAYAQQGDFVRALEGYERAVDEAQMHGNNDALSVALVDLAELHLQLGMTWDARRRLSEALRLLPAGRSGKERSQAILHGAIASLLDGRAAEALTACAKARGAFEAEGNDSWCARCDMLTARALLQQRDLGAAIATALRARDAFENLGQGIHAGAAELLIAECEILIGTAAAALGRLDRLARRAAEVRTPWLEIELRRLTGRAFFASGSTVRAFEEFAAAVQALEAFRGRVPADEFMVSFLSSKSQLYAETVECLLILDRSEEAFDYAERARSRALVDMMWARGASRAEGGPAWLAVGRVTAKSNELSSVYSLIHKAGAEGLPLDGEAWQHLRARADDLEQLIAANIRAAQIADPEFMSLRTVDAPSPEEIRAVMSPGATLVEYFVTPARVLACVLTRGSLAWRELPITPKDLARRVQKFRFHMSDVVTAVEPGSSIHDLRCAASLWNLAELERVLFEPLRDLVVGREVTVVPHDVIHSVPFHALPDGNGWLADGYDISYLPSAAIYVFDAAKPKSAEGPTVVFAIPDDVAPAIDREADGVAAALGDACVVNRGADASWAAVQEASRTARVLHIATHAQFHRRAPMLSTLRVADRWVNLYDVYSLDVRSDLVVLSACETGAAHISSGGELLGLVRGWLYAGARRLLLAQWRIDDQAASVFMHSLYVGIGAGRTYHEALRGAMETVRELFPHPYYWAPFFLIGRPG